MIKENKNGIAITITTGLKPKDMDYCFMASIQMDPIYNTPNIVVVSSGLFDSEEQALSEGQTFMSKFYNFIMTRNSKEEATKEFNELLQKYKCEVKPLEQFTFQNGTDTAH